VYRLKTPGDSTPATTAPSGATAGSFESWVSKMSKENPRFLVSYASTLMRRWLGVNFGLEVHAGRAFFLLNPMLTDLLEAHEALAFAEGYALAKLGPTSPKYKVLGTILREIRNRVAEKMMLYCYFGK